MKITKVDRKYRFVSTFDTDTGYYERTGVFKGEYETPEDPFMASYPELLDVGILGHCDHASQCTVGCYQGGLQNQKPNMSLKDYKSIIDQSKGKLFQIALGGHGDPNKHEDFEEILRYTREANIVPNYTTSGLNLSDREVELTKKYCGAVAVSWYRADYTVEALRKFTEAGCITNIHYVLSNKTIDEAIDYLKHSFAFPGAFGSINAIIFLTHKNVGCGSAADLLDVNDPRLKEFFSLVSNDHPFRIGFDSCAVPGLVNFTTGLDQDSFDGCEGATFSGYISSDMQIIPCSFDQEFKWGVDLKKYSIKEAWVSPQFDDFRDKIKNNCKGCRDVALCKSGCPIKREIVLCNRGDRKV